MSMIEELEGKPYSPGQGIMAMVGVDEPEARFRIPRAPAPKKFPPGRKYHELPKWSEVVIVPEIVKRAYGSALLRNTAQTAKDKYNNFMNDLKYTNPNPFEKMAEDAANWYLTKNKR